MSTKPDRSQFELDRLRRSVSELSALNEIAAAVTAQQSLEAVAKVVVDHAVRRLNAEEGAVFLSDTGEQSDMVHTLVRDIGSGQQLRQFRLHTSLVGWMEKNKTILSLDTETARERFPGLNLEQLGIRSLVAAPLIGRKKLVGVIAAFNKQRADSFTNDDRRFIGIIGAQMAPVIENAALREQERQYELVEAEMQQARQIQDQYLVPPDVNRSDCTVAAVSYPARSVGGDLYLATELPDNSVLLVVGDVSGKGVPAALLGAQMVATLRTVLATSSGELDLGRLVSVVNDQLIMATRPEQFVTAAFAHYQPETNTVDVINAGHPVPHIVGVAGEHRQVEPTCLLLGVMPLAGLTPERQPLNPGDTIVLYSDGVTEAENNRGEMFDETMLATSVRAHAPTVSEAADFARVLEEELRTFMGDEPAADDITIATLRRQ